MDKPTIVIFSAFLSPFRSGAEACAEEVALVLHERYNIVILTARLSRQLPVHDTLQNKVTVHRVGLGYGFDKWLFPFLAPLVARRYSPALIHAILETFAGLALVIARCIAPSAKRLLTLQTTNATLLKKTIIRSADTVTAISKVLIAIAKRERSDAIHHISNGVPGVIITKALKRTKKVPGRLVFVGRLEPMKGVDTLLRAFARVLEELEQHAELYIVGDGSQRSKLEELAALLQIEKQVLFKGFIAVPDVYNEFAAAEIFCGLSRSEALGSVFIEAQASCCAILGTTVGGIPDNVEHEVSGLLVPPDDVEAAYEALKRLITDSDLRQKCVNHGAKNAAQYDWSAIAEEYSEVYEDLVKKTKY